MKSHSILAALSGYSFHYSNEDDLQSAIEKIFVAKQIPHIREFRANKTDRPDFMCFGTVAVEVKVDGSAAEVLRQVHRYAQEESILEIILVTDKVRHQVPDELNSKPVFTHSLLMGAF